MIKSCHTQAKELQMSIPVAHGLSLDSCPPRVPDAPEVLLSPLSVWTGLANVGEDAGGPPPPTNLPGHPQTPRSFKDSRLQHQVKIGKRKRFRSFIKGNLNVSQVRLTENGNLLILLLTPLKPLKPQLLQLPLLLTRQLLLLLHNVTNITPTATATSTTSNTTAAYYYCYCYYYHCHYCY